MSTLVVSSLVLQLVSKNLASKSAYFPDSGYSEKSPVLVKRSYLKAITSTVLLPYLYWNRKRRIWPSLVTCAIVMVNVRFRRLEPGRYKNRVKFM